ncbi:alpha/beta hydrolase family protein [Brucella intermedia]|uniref:alpha/beta hydrolase family protein n=1 Tax=Brucella intermedia TaxID=94625 RepID=UPI0034CF12C7
MEIMKLYASELAPFAPRWLHRLRLIAGIAWLTAIVGSLPVQAAQPNGTLLEAEIVRMTASAACRSHPSIGREDFLEQVRIRRITYASDGLPVAGYLMEPLAPGKHPAIIYNRGGYGEFGALAPDVGLLQLADLAAEGYVVVASQYRGTAGAPGHDEFGGADVADVLNLIPLLDAMDNVDASRIGMMGHSRGGMMTYLALARTTRIKAAVILAGPADLAGSLDERPEMARVYETAIDARGAQLVNALRKRSAVNWVDKLPKDVPLLLVHGTADWRVSPTESIRMASLLLEYRVPFRLMLLEGDDHGLTGHPIELRVQTRQWFGRYLKQAVPLPVLEPHGG